MANNNNEKEDDDKHFHFAFFHNFFPLFIFSFTWGVTNFVLIRSFFLLDERKKWRAFFVWMDLVSMECGWVVWEKDKKLLRVRVNTRASKKEEKKTFTRNYKCLNFVNDDIFLLLLWMSKKVRFFWDDSELNFFVLNFLHKFETGTVSMTRAVLKLFKLLFLLRLNVTFFPHFFI